MEVSFLYLRHVCMCATHTIWGTPLSVGTCNNHNGTNSCAHTHEPPQHMGYSVGHGIAHTVAAVFAAAGCRLHRSFSTPNTSSCGHASTPSKHITPPCLLCPSHLHASTLPVYTHPHHKLHTPPSPLTLHCQVASRRLGPAPAGAPPRARMAAGGGPPRLPTLTDPTLAQQLVAQILREQLEEVRGRERDVE